ncbi:MAG: hypothetical protein RJB66_1859 [Pseudomonadota bacterium]|jgi:hypothetical protein
MVYKLMVRTLKGKAPRHLLVFHFLFLMAIRPSVSASELNLSSKRFSDFRTTFSSSQELSGVYSKYQDWSQWSETQTQAKDSKRFDPNNKHGFVFSVTTLRFRQNIDLFERPHLSLPSAQELFFPEIQYKNCNSSSCQAVQKVGPFLPDAHYLSFYRIVRLSGPEDLLKFNVPKKLLTDLSRFPKYLMLQTGTHWSNYFQRANSITVFEPDQSNPDWIQIRSYQVLSLNAIGAVGKSSIRSALNRQIESFLIAFGKL